MSLLEKLFMNDSIKKAAFGQLKKAMTEAGADFATVRIDDAGEIDVQTYRDSEYLVYKSAEINELARIYGMYLEGKLIEKGVTNGK